ncbi:TM2 domain-containing protein [Anabaena sp. FACHB-1237]|uniref:TM2 domain-containing protein n=1 Tax=Anabaena sp. FACHB-1237 TaxID=2692769 RepID=UPI001680B97D|nr:TM2 domain-containing protein [Anabaena sp. FACHB-1237]MBD2137204.1 TM2 domain-containing protein [Anabaena sp. FACHB-1237]
MNLQNHQNKDRLIASYILCAAGFLGVNGLHRLYNGKIGTGLLWFCTFGFFYVGQFIDLLLIPGMVDEYETNLRLKAGLSPIGVPANQAIVNAQVYKPETKQLTVKLIEAAEANGGSLTVTQAVKFTSGSFKEVEKALLEMVHSGYIRVGNNPNTGAVTYYFDEL